MKNRTAEASRSTRHPDTLDPNPLPLSPKPRGRQIEEEDEEEDYYLFKNRTAEEIPCYSEKELEELYIDYHFTYNLTTQDPEP